MFFHLFIVKIMKIVQLGRKRKIVFFGKKLEASAEGVRYYIIEYRIDKIIAAKQKLS